METLLRLGCPGSDNHRHIDTIYLNSVIKERVGVIEERQEFFRMIFHNIKRLY